MSTPRPGVDYLVDYYAVLGLDRGASADTIAVRLRERYKQYHPDRYAGLAPEFERQAGTMMRVLTEAAEHLGTPASRERYDARLDAWTGPLSRSGLPVIDLAGQDDALLLADVLGLGPSPDAAALLEARITAASGFNQTIHDVLAEQYAASADPSAMLRQAYAASLAQLDRHVSLRESFALARVGLGRTIPAHPRADHAAAIAERLAGQRAQVLQAADGYLLAMEAGTVPALSSGEAGIVAEIHADGPAALARYHQAAAERYDVLAAEASALSIERQAVIEQRTALLEGTYQPAQPERFERLAMRISLGEQVLWMAFRLDDSVVVSDEALDHEQLSAAEDPAAALDMVASGRNVMHLEIADGLPVDAALEQVLRRHFEMVSMTLT